MLMKQLNQIQNLGKGNGPINHLNSFTIKKKFK